MPAWTPARLNGIPVESSITRKFIFSYRTSRLKDHLLEHESLITVSRSDGPLHSFSEMVESIKDNKEIEAIYNNGVKNLQLNNLDSALIWFDKAEQMGFMGYDLFYNRGITYFKMRNIDAACVNWLDGARLGDTEAESLYNKKCR
jgi:hypothetical protein